MRTVRPRILMITPILPAQSGNGLAMRCGVFLEALSLAGSVELMVVPFSDFRDAEAVSYARKLCTKVTIIESEGRTDTLLDMILRTSDEDKRLEMFARYGLPSTCGRLSSPVIRDACDLVTGLNFDMTVVVRNHSGPLIAAIRRKTGIGSLVIDLDDDDGGFHRELAAHQTIQGNGIEARWNELEAVAFDRLTISNAKHADLTTVSNASQVSSLSERTGIQPPVVIPNSIAMSKPCKPVDDPIMIMVGTLNYKANSDGVLWFINEILPRIRSTIPDVQLIVAGQKPPKEVRKITSRKGVTLVSDAPDLTAYYQSSMLAVVPLLNGSGTRIKILEAAAFGLPVVATEKGAEGLDLNNNEHAWITPTDPEAFATACIEALTSVKQRARRAKRLRQHVAERYERSMIISQITNLMLEQMQSKQNQEKAETP